MSESENRPVGNRAALRQRWVERLQRFAQADLTVVAFCQLEGVSTQAFYYWKHQLQPQTPTSTDTPRFLPVRWLGQARTLHCPERVPGYPAFVPAAMKSSALRATASGTTFRRRRLRRISAQFFRISSACRLPVRAW
jgi:hypothetical protein